MIALRKLLTRKITSLNLYIYSWIFYPWSHIKLGSNCNQTISETKIYVEADIMISIIAP